MEETKPQVQDSRNQDSRNQDSRSQDQQQEEHLRRVLAQSQRAKRLLSDPFLLECFREAVNQRNSRILKLDPKQSDDFAVEVAARDAIIQFQRGLEQMVQAGINAAMRLQGEKTLEQGGLL